MCVYAWIQNEKEKTNQFYTVDQDTDLDHLSSAIRRQRELGLLIGDELETHAQLIDETEAMVDNTDERLRQAKKKLDYVGRKVKDNSKSLIITCLTILLITKKKKESVCIVIGLIIVFFILVSLFR